MHAWKGSWDSLLRTGSYFVFREPTLSSLVGPELSKHQQTIFLVARLQAFKHCRLTFDVSCFSVLLNDDYIMLMGQVAGSWRPVVGHFITLSSTIAHIPHYALTESAKARQHSKHPLSHMFLCTPVPVVCVRWALAVHAIHALLAVPSPHACISSRSSSVIFIAAVEHVMTI